MAYKYLTNLADVLRAAGLDVVEVGGWRTRGRPSSSGGFDPVGVLCHHTATSKASSTDAVLRLLVGGRSDLPGPLCQLGLGRDGTVYVVAAGRANHGGKAKSSGTVAAGDANSLYIGIEAFNDGVGEPWPAVQYDAYVKLCAVLCQKITGNSAQTVRGHKETSVTGKIDPTFSMDKFRADVAAAMKPAPKPVATKPEPKPAARVLKAGSWNMRVGRRPAVAVRETLELLKEHDLDVLTVCEAEGYVHILDRELDGYSIHTAFESGDSACDSAVIVRDGLRVKGMRLHRLERIGWERKPGRIGLHWPRSAVSVNVEGVRIMSLHMPPGPFKGPSFWRRGVAFDSSARKVRDIGKRWKGRPWVIAGDWNMGKRLAGTEADPSVSWIASEVGGHIKGNGIDYLMHHMCRVTDFKRIDHGTSDHKPVLFTVHVPKEN